MLHRLWFRAWDCTSPQEIVNNLEEDTGADNDNDSQNKAVTPPDPGNIETIVLACNVGTN